MVQILASCSSDLGNCCSDYTLVTVLDIIKQFLNLIQLIAPILLIISLVIQFTRLLANPDDKKGTKRLINTCVATVLCFFVPFLVNLVLTLVPDTIGSFELGACWDAAANAKEVLKEANSTYVSTSSRKPQMFILTPDAYGDIQITDDSSNSSGSAKGKEIVAYAKSFVGHPYVWGGVWNGELPYTGTDCSGFVQGVFRHFGINLTRTTYTQWADTGSYSLVTDGNVKAGDLVMYDGHVAMITGNGKEIVHALNPRVGIVITPNYDYQPLLGIMRINGVN